MTAKDLEHALREGGEKVTEGKLRIDSARALQRLRDFRFADPSHWVLEVLRAAVLGGATKVEVETDADDVVVRFDGAPFPADAMRHLLEKALEPGATPDERRTRLLALGAAGALGSNAVFVKVESGNVALTLTQTQVQLTAQKTSGTKLHLRKSFGWRVISGFLRGSPESKAIAARAHRFPARLLLEGKSPVRAHPFDLPTFSRRTVTGRGWTLEVSLPKGPPLPHTTLELDVSGVLVASRVLLTPGVQVQAWLRADGLRRNASGSDVVDDDEVLLEAQKALRKATRELLETSLESLCEDDAWRRAFVGQLLEPSQLDAKGKEVLERAPLLPGPADERSSVAAVTEALRQTGRLYVAKQRWPKGTYPEPTVLLAGNLELAKLLPVGHRVDVEVLVRQRERVVSNRALHELREVEPPELKERDWDVRGPIAGTDLTGEVGFARHLHGAFVRVLHRGRLFEAGELAALAPLRLRAVVEWGRPLGDTFFDDSGAAKLLGLVVKHVEDAATRAVCAALPRPEAVAHALDLLSRLVVQRGGSMKQLPDALRDAAVFAGLDGELVSLRTLADESRWRYVMSEQPHGLLDGGRVLVLSPAQHAILTQLNGKRLENVVGQLAFERELRQRMAGPHERPVVHDAVVKVSLVGEGLTGEVGIPREPSAWLELTLIKDGLRLETTELTARYQHAVASVASPRFSPNAKWTAVTRDDGFQRALAAVSDAQRRLGPALVKLPREAWSPGAERFFLAFLDKELRAFTPGSLDDDTRAVAEAKLFDAGNRRVSLLDLQATPRLLTLSPAGRRPVVPDDLLVLFEAPSMITALREVLGRTSESAGPQLERREARHRLESFPVWPFELPSGLQLERRLTGPHFTALVGLREGASEETRVQVVVAGRAWTKLELPSPLPLTMCVEWPQLELNATQTLTAPDEDALRQVVDFAVREVARDAAARLEGSPALGAAAATAKGGDATRASGPAVTAGGEVGGSATDVTRGTESAAAGSARQGSGAASARPGRSNGSAARAVGEAHGSGSAADATRSSEPAATGTVPSGPATDEAARRVVLLMLGHCADRELPEADAEALRRALVFPCTDGVTRDLHGVSSDAPRYVLTPMQGSLPDRQPIIVADTEALRVATRRWSGPVRAEEALRLQLAALRQREGLAPVEEIVARVESPWRQRLSANGLTGEVVIARDGAGRLELFLDRKPLCVVAGALPAPYAAAIDSPRLTPKPGFSGVETDAHFREVIDAVTASAAGLAAQLGQRPAPPGWEPTRVHLALQLAAEQAWEWKGKRKARGKKRKPAAEALELPPLTRAPLLRASDGSSLRIEDLIRLQQEFGKVEVTHRGGTFLEPGRRAWWPRADEATWAAGLGLTFVDVSEALALADSIRARPKFARIDAPLEGPWREPVRGTGLEGEVALGDVPSGELHIEVLHERMWLERWSSPHPVGGSARVDSAALTPEAQFTSAKRDASFKAMVVATEAALERLLVRRLAHRDERFPEWARGAVRWRAGQAGALAAVLPALPLFTSLVGTPVTMGAVLELASRTGRVMLASATTPSAGGAEVMLDTPETRATLKTLGLRFDDVTAELRRTEDLKLALTSRRLASLTWVGDALVRVAVAAGPLRGELALSDSPGSVMLARDGIAVQPLEVRWPGVVGVIDLEGLAVDEGWTKATPTRAQVSLVRAEVERLFVALAEASRGFGHDDRERAAAWALGFLAEGGLESAAQVERLTGAGQALADAPLFLTVEGVKVNLRAVAGEVSSRNRVAVFERSGGRPDHVSACVLSTSSFAAPWLTVLATLLGRNRVWRVTDLRAWEDVAREADPPDGTALLAGLRALRKEVRLLRAGALGRLTPDDLEDVKFRRDGGRTPLRYDAKRKVVFLDPEDVPLARALTELESRPERLWVLLAAVFGLVNRELEHVTDADEAQLLFALVGHLASNPKLLG